MQKVSALVSPQVALGGSQKQHQSPQPQQGPQQQRHLVQGGSIFCGFSPAAMSPVEVQQQQGGAAGILFDLGARGWWGVDTSQEDR